MLSPREMQDFIRDNKDEIDEIKAPYKMHEGYRVIEVAKQKMVKGSVGEIARYKDIILSALKGIGIKGGLSKRKKATPYERRMGILALYAIGINIDEVSEDSQISLDGITTPEQRKHIEICNRLISGANSIRGDSIGEPSTEADKFYGLIDKTRVALSRQSFPLPDDSYDSADFRLGEKADLQYRKVPILLSFEGATKQYLRKEKVFKTDADKLVMAFKVIMESHDYKKNKPLLAGDNLVAKRSVLFSLYQDESLRALFEEKEVADKEISGLVLMIPGSVKSSKLKSRSKFTVQKMLTAVHPDKTKFDPFTYDATKIMQIIEELVLLITQSANIEIKTFLDRHGALSLASS
ncbi:MAG: hypothetical protein K2Q34_05800 [Alphaproteobacteria bacterium]|nr:hypothetical protein [Alphaproteobacteria bacterium]